MAVFTATILVIIALAVLPLLTPLFIHPVLEAAGSAARLGLDPLMARAMSDQSVQELLFGPGTFAFPGPDGAAFYDAAERGHLADARLLLWLCLAAGTISAVVLVVSLVRASAEDKARLWRLVSWAGAAVAGAVVVIGLVSLVAFGTLFSLFHQVFFPGGNWSFDPATQRLVQLYPFAFWQLTAVALGALILLFGLGSWLLGRAMVWRAGLPSRADTTSSVQGS